MEWGAAFDRDPDGTPALASRPRTASAASCTRATRPAARSAGCCGSVSSALPGVVTHSHARVVDLIVEDGRCAGVEVPRRTTAAWRPRVRPCALLATGGAGQVFSETTNPPVATGDGVAMAFRAGAAVADLEFVQFHPTALNVPGQPRFLLSEALRGEGARLVNADGEAFMTRYDPAGDLAPRDRVSRAIVRESNAHRAARSSCRSISSTRRSCTRGFRSSLMRAAAPASISRRDRIPVGPAAHYVMGGVVHRTSMAERRCPGLFAAGEVACTGVHGANRLASNSLLEGLVFGARAGRAMRADTKGGGGAKGAGGDKGAANATGAKGAGNATEGITAAEIQSLMWRDVGLFRDRAGLDRALLSLETAWADLDALVSSGTPLDADSWRRASILTVGRLIARAALRREESRGGHYRSDFPKRDDINWKRRVAETR